MKRIALATYTGYSKGTESDQLLREPFQNAGHEAVFVSWDNKRVDWHQFDAVIIRSCWDYHTRLNEFLDWVTMLEDNHIPVWNPVPILKWNTKKTYLADLQKCGIEAVPTVFVTKNDTVDLASFGWDDIVVKPAIGASSYKIRRFAKTEFSKAADIVSEMAKVSDVLIQPLMSEVFGGEVSLVFIGGRYSHAVMKVPKKGDFRSQAEYGGSRQLYALPQDLQAQAELMYQKIDMQLLYARLDVLMVDSQLMLMELELVEPELYFDLSPGSIERFVQSFNRLQL